tara:strand:- start:14 stop:382 length:369 start_codon:yes stop_codon:yes gene_type:complete
MNIQALILRVITGATAQLVELANDSGVFARSVASELDAADIASELDAADIAYELDYSQLVDEVSLRDLGNEIDYSQLAEHISSDPAPAPVSDGVLSRMSQQVLEAAVTRLLTMANEHVENGN